jgi:tRNA modification GTPase
MLYKSDDTIAAISTPFGSGGIGIIRMSGDKAFEIADKVYKGKKKIKDMKSHTINYGKIIDPTDGSVIDEVLLSKMDNPHTFTREDVIEINCHSGAIVLKRILELLIRTGARLAEPGEFTKRAFLNGRIDLSQAEAVMDIINAKTIKSSKVALEQLEGKLSSRIKDIRDELISLIAQIEVTLDYPEEDVDKIAEEEVYFSLKNIKIKLKELLESFNKGKILREGICVVIVGRPNVGKSSLLNELTGYNRAIVTDLPGTTRDIIEEYINIKGIPVRLIDTAGIRETGDVVEQIGVDMAREAINKADLVIMMLDFSEGLTDEDIEILKTKTLKEKKMIILANKIDLVDGSDYDKNENKNKNSTEDSLPDIYIKLKELLDLQVSNKVKIIKTSMVKGIGLKNLEDEISRMFIGGEIESTEDAMVTNIRHADLIQKTLNNVKDAISAYESCMPLDCITVDIRNAVYSLGEITGESVSEDIINEIFSRFCIGK